MPNAIVDLECSWVGIDAAQPSLSSGEGRLEMKHSTQEWPQMPVKFEAAELPGLVHQIRSYEVLSLIHI